MKQRIKYTEEPMDNGKIVSDFLPAPGELVLKEETVKITISLSRESIDFFKHIARIHNTGYQKLIRRLLDEYVLRHKKAS